MKNHWLAQAEALKERIGQTEDKPSKGGAFISQKEVEKLKEAMLQSCQKPQETGQSMGFAGHPFAQVNVTIPRTFRFLVEPKSHPDMKWMIKRCAINYYEETIHLELYEHPDFTTHDYLLYLADSQNKDHELTLTALDGCGRKLYMLYFKGVEPNDHLVEYDYARSDVLTHKLTLSYESMKRIDNVH
jgi:hypothetical protein